MSKDRYKKNSLREWVRDKSAKQSVLMPKDDAIALLEKLLMLDPEKRITAIAAFQVRAGTYAVQPP